MRLILQKYFRGTVVICDWGLFCSIYKTSWFLKFWSCWRCYTMLYQMTYGKGIFYTSTTTDKLLPSIRTKLPTESSLNERKASISCNRRNICFHTLPALSSTEPITEDRPLKLPPKTPVSGIEPITGLGHLSIRVQFCDKTFVLTVWFA